jgi:hypothetical protein
MKVGDLVKLKRDSDYQPQIFRRGMVGIVEAVQAVYRTDLQKSPFVDVRVSGAGDRPVVSYLAMDLEVINESR